VVEEEDIQELPVNLVDQVAVVVALDQDLLHKVPLLNLVLHHLFLSSLVEVLVVVQVLLQLVLLVVAEAARLEVVVVNLEELAELAFNSPNSPDH